VTRDTTKRAGVRVYRKGPAADTPLHRQIHEQLHAAIARGDLRPGDRLPTSRALAKELRVARNTVEAAIARLVSEGLVERRVGSGTRVTRVESRDAASAQMAREGELQ
jgi:GntR family transcriptional regulator / MocR family aminotransferase